MQSSLDKEHERLLREGWRLGADGCYRKALEEVKK